MRFALAQQVDALVLPKLATEISRLLEFGMGDDSTVSVVIRKGGERYRAVDSLHDAQDRHHEVKR